MPQMFVSQGEQFQFADTVFGYETMWPVGLHYFVCNYTVKWTECDRGVTQVT